MNASPVVGTLQSASLTSVLGAVDALKNYRALTIDVVGNIVASILFFLFASTNAWIIAFVGFLIAALASLVAFNAAGIILMEEVRGQEPRATADALIAGVFATVQGVGVLIAAVLIVIATALVVALLLFVCKLPGLGPILFIPVFPVSIVVMGVVMTALGLLLLPIASAAIWGGEGVVQALSRVIVAARERLVGILVRILALLLLIGLAGIIVWSVLISGLLATSGMSVGILNIGVGLPSMAAIFGGELGGRGGGFSYGTAAFMGGMVLVGLAATLPLVMLQKGWCLIYREMVEDLDAGAIEAEMQQRLAEVRQRAAAVQQRVREQNLRAAVPPAEPDTVLPAGPVAAAATCPSCNASIQPADAFCGECGAKLR